jgi:serine/threonine-protein kinase
MMPAPDYSGRTLEGRYKVIKPLAEGSMGSVYLGEHALIGRRVAIKVLHSKFVAEDEIVERFHREARAATSIDHPNIIDVFDIGETEEGDPYLVMEYLEGESLAAMMERVGTLDLAAACGILEPMLEALEAVHRAGVVHRDLKPDNIFIVAGADGDDAPLIKLIDFGISKFTREIQQTQLTLTGHVLGTPAYMPPEQARGEREVDLRADIYSVGVILYEMLSGWLPFSAADYQAILDLVVRGEPTPPKNANPDFPDKAVDVVMKALSRDPDERYGSAAELLAAVRRFDGFDLRSERLSTLTSGNTVLTCAAGDLGRRVRDRGSARELVEKELARLAEKSAEDSGPRTPPRRRGPFRVVAGIAALVVAALVLVFVLDRGDDSTDSASSTESTPGDEAAPIGEVSIEVRGVPDGAAIFYDSAPMPTNPFSVPVGDAVVPLKVQATGFEPFAVSVVPSKDQQVQVRLIPLDIAHDGRPGEGGSVDTAGSLEGSAKKAKVKPKPKDQNRGESDSFIREFE